MNKIDKKFEDIKVIDLKTTALEYIRSMDKLNYKLAPKSEIEFYFVYNNLMGEERIINKGCSTCLKRMKNDLAKFLNKNPISDDDERLVKAWRDAMAYVQADKNCNC